MLIAGLSAGIYALLGSLSIQGSNFIPKYILIPMLGFSPFFKYIFIPFSTKELTQSAFHFLGFLVGIAVFCLIHVPMKKKKILQGDLDG